jgi:hypothetical protein
MQLLKVLPAPLFAALVASAPLAAPQISVEYEQFLQFSRDVQAFADSTSSQFSQVSAQFDILTGTYSGSGRVRLTYTHPGPLVMLI